MKKMINDDNNFIKEKYYDTLDDLTYYLRTGILQITSGVTEFDNENLEKVFNINAELQIRIDKAIKKLSAAINHYDDPQKDFALKAAIKILRGEK